MSEQPRVWIVTVDRPTSRILESLRYRIEGTWLEAKQKAEAAARAERPHAIYSDTYVTVEGDPSLGNLKPNREI